MNDSISLPIIGRHSALSDSKQQPQLHLDGVLIQAIISFRSRIDVISSKKIGGNDRGFTD